MEAPHKDKRVVDCEGRLCRRVFFLVLGEVEDDRLMMNGWMCSLCWRVNGASEVRYGKWLERFRPKDW